MVFGCLAEGAALPDIDDGEFFRSAAIVGLPPLLLCLIDFPRFSWGISVIVVFVMVCEGSRLVGWLPRLGLIYFRFHGVTRDFTCPQT